MDSLPDHIIIDIFHYLENNDMNIVQLEALVSYPILLVASKRYYKLYHEYFIKNQQFVIYLVRMGVFPLYKNIFTNLNEAKWYLKKQLQTYMNHNQMPSKYPLDYYLIIRFRKGICNSFDFHSKQELNLLLDENHEYKYYILDQIKELISKSHDKTRTFVFNGMNNYYLEG